MHLRKPIGDNAAPSASPLPAGSKSAEASSPFRYALPADNKADEIAADSLSRCHTTSVSKYSSAAAREVVEASARQR